MRLGNAWQPQPWGGTIIWTLSPGTPTGSKIQIRCLHGPGKGKGGVIIVKCTQSLLHSKSLLLGENNLLEPNPSWGNGIPPSPAPFNLLFLAKGDLVLQTKRLRTLHLQKGVKDWEKSCTWQETLMKVTALKKKKKKDPLKDFSLVR